MKMIQYQISKKIRERGVGYYKDFELIYKNQIFENEKTFYNIPNRSIIEVKEKSISGCILRLRGSLFNDDDEGEINEKDNKFTEANKLLIYKIVELENIAKNKADFIRKTYKDNVENDQISVISTSADENILLSFIVKKKDYFKILENKFYESYPDYKKKMIIFMVNGNLIDTNKTIEENKIKNSDNILLIIKDGH